MDDHDQRFKVLLKEFLPEFLSLFFPAWAERLDLSRVEWLDAEAFVDPPRGERLETDLLTKVPTREEVAPLRHGEQSACLALVHIEVEAPDRKASFPARMLDYYIALRRKYNMPVLPIALFLRVGLDGLGWDVVEETLWGKTLIRFEYAYVGLPALDGVGYAAGANVLGVALAALMKLPRDQQAKLKAESLRHILESAQNAAQKELLMECLNAYFPLEGDQAAAFSTILDANPYREVKQMVSRFRLEGRAEGRVQGRAEGRAEGKREILLKMLQRKFGPLPGAVNKKLDVLPTERLEEIAVALFDAMSLADLGLTDE